MQSDPNAPMTDRPDPPRAQQEAAPPKAHPGAAAEGGSMMDPAEREDYTPEEPAANTQNNAMVPPTDAKKARSPMAIGLGVIGVIVVVLLLVTFI